MPLLPLSSQDQERVAEALILHWKERGMNYNKQWALEYLRRGHQFDIVSVRFFVYKDEGGKLIGSIALVQYEGNVAEIRDEVVFPPFERKQSLKQILCAAVEQAKKFYLRKVYSLALPADVETYRTLGFQQEGMLKDHFKIGEDLTVMSLFLNM